MQYMALIYDTREHREGLGPAARARMNADYAAFTAAAKQAGVFVAGDALDPVGSAVTVRVRGGEVITTDGPFAETKEHLGGYYLLECEDLDEALRWAARIPTAAQGSIEVRRVRGGRPETAAAAAERDGGIAR